MVEYLPPAKLQEAYNDVVELGIDGLKDLESKHVYQLKRKAEDIFQESEPFINALRQLGNEHLTPEQLNDITRFEIWTGLRKESEYVMHVISLWEQLRDNKQNQEAIEALQAWSDSIQERYQEMKIKHSKIPKEKFPIDTKAFVRLVVDLELLTFNDVKHEDKARMIQHMIESKDHRIFDIVKIHGTVELGSLIDFIKVLNSAKKNAYHSGNALISYNSLKDNVLIYMNKK
jgi:hypothetical protein